MIMCVSRTTEDRIVRIVRDNTPKGKRSAGRQDALVQLIFFEKMDISLTETKKKTNNFT
jgi:hypothetical protein